MLLVFLIKIDPRLTPKPCSMLLTLCYLWTSLEMYISSHLLLSINIDVLTTQSTVGGDTASRLHSIQFCKTRSEPKTLQKGSYLPVDKGHRVAAAAATTTPERIVRIVMALLNSSKGCVRSFVRSHTSISRWHGMTDPQVQAQAV